MESRIRASFVRMFRHRVCEQRDERAKRERSGPSPDNGRQSHAVFNAGMSIGREFGRVCRDTRLRLDLSQQAVADSVRISRGYLAHMEAGRANPSLALLERLGEALGLRIELIASPPIFLSARRQHDTVHARCSGAIDRRLRSCDWIVAREVELWEGRVHGWIDLLAFHPRSGILLIIEIKTRLDDLGATERQIAWYERHAVAAARRLGWQPRQAAAWLIALWSDEVDSVIAANREIFARFPDRAGHMLKVLQRRIPRWAWPRPA